MENARLDQLIIDMAHNGVSHADIIRTLVTQGYDTEQIQERVNELYYAGALEPSASDQLRRAGVYELDRSVVDEDKRAQEVLRISRFKKCVLWLQLHPLKAAMWLTVALAVFGAGIGGYKGYISAPLTVMRHKATMLANLPMVAFTITKQASAHNTSSFVLRGVARASGEESIDASFSVQNEEKPWHVQIVRDANSVVYLRLLDGPVPYSFIYNTWISLGSDMSGARTLATLGLQDIYDYTLIARALWLGFSFPDAYQSITEQPPVATCVLPYHIAFTPSISEKVPSAGTVSEYVRSLFSGSVWNVCAKPSQEILTASSGDFSATLFIPATAPTFSIDVPPISIETVGRWIENEKGQ